MFYHYNANCLMYILKCKYWFSHRGCNFIAGYTLKTIALNKDSDKHNNKIIYNVKTEGITIKTYYCSIPNLNNTNSSHILMGTMIFETTTLIITKTYHLLFKAVHCTC